MLPTGFWPENSALSTANCGLHFFRKGDDFSTPTRVAFGIFARRLAKVGFPRRQKPMKIAVTADNHFAHCAEPEESLRHLQGRIDEAGAVALCILGDMTEGLTGPAPLRRQTYRCALSLLGHKKPCYWVLGNHDLWDPMCPTPPEAMSRVLAALAGGVPLETGWEDMKTAVWADDCVFVGSMGFPDFKHPLVAKVWKRLDCTSATVDNLFLDLSKGWRFYTEPMQKAFGARLERAFGGPSSHVVVLTHYPILGGQSCLDHIDTSIWPYFFNYTMGEMVLWQANRHRDKTVWCLAGHSHEYCQGHWRQEAENCYSHGINTTYGKQALLVFGTGEAPV
jgi:hypothetical protein